MTSSLQEQLDAFANGECPPEAFLGELLAHCNQTPDSSWEALALLDQYHRRGKVSADHFRLFRHKIEFQALGIAEPGMSARVHVQPATTPASRPAATCPVPITVIAVPAVPPENVSPAPPAEMPEVLKLRSALESERERSRRYRHRINTLAQYGHRHRAPGSSLPVSLAPPAAAANGLAKWMRHPQGVRVAAWLKQPRRQQRARAWLSAVALVTAATVITGSSSNLGPVRITADLVTTPVTFEPAPPLPAAILEPQTISLSSGRFVVYPGASTATIQVDRTGDTGSAASVKLWTQSAGAKSGKDYVGKSQIVQFEPGQASVQLPVRILANPKRAHTEMFYVAIAAPDDDITVGENSRAAVFIMRAN